MKSAVQGQAMTGTGQAISGNGRSRPEAGGDRYCDFDREVVQGSTNL